MKHLICALFIISIVSLTGCQSGRDETKTNPEEMNEKDLPDVRAFEDEFTRSFLQSTEETKTGYYPFVSGTGTYKMDFPAGGVIGEKGYGIDKNNFEGYLVGVATGEALDSSINFEYYSYKKEKFSDSGLETLKQQFNAKITFEKVPFDNHMLFLAPIENGDGVFGYVAFLQNTLKSGAISIIYESECTADEKACKGVKNKEKDDIVNWLESIEFIENEIDENK